MVKIEVDGMICEKLEEIPEVEVEEQKLVTCPPDPRFQQQNKTNWCYRMFIDFHRCAHYLGTGNERCKVFKSCYKSLCPNSWISDWHNKIEEGTFPRDLTKEMGR